MTLPNTFWGDVTLDIGHCAIGRLGAHALYLRRERAEWYIASGVLADAGESAWSLTKEEDSPFEDHHTSRTVFERSPESVHVSPRLPDRSLVVRPVTEIGIPPAQRVSIFVSTPLWVDVSIGEPATTIYQQPLDRPPDTWFGGSTKSGELCYAARTNARLNLENIVMPPSRGLTQIKIDNQSAATIKFSRLRLPLPQLGLYCDDAGLLWTEPASLVSREGALAQLQIDTNDAWLEGKVKIQEPREIDSDGLLNRTMGLFFGRSEARLGD